MDKRSLNEISRRRAEIAANDAKEKKIHEKGVKLREDLRVFENKAIMSDVESVQMPAEIMCGVIELFKEGKLTDIIKNFVTTGKDKVKDDANSIKKEEGNE